MYPAFNFHEYLPVLNLVIKAVEWFAKLYARIRTEHQKSIDGRILDYLDTKTTPASAEIIWADAFLKPIMEDVPFKIAFPPRLQGWARLKLELERFPYELRHRWRVWTGLVPEQRVNEHLLRLSLEGSIQRNWASRYSKSDESQR